MYDIATVLRRKMKNMTAMRMTELRLLASIASKKFIFSGICYLDKLMGKKLEFDLDVLPLRSRRLEVRLRLETEHVSYDAAREHLQAVSVLQDRVVVGGPYVRYLVLGPRKLLLE